MTRSFLIVLCVLLSGCSSDLDVGSKVGTADLFTLSSGFIDPPASSRPGAFWAWLNGDVTDASITNDLEEMKAKGMELGMDSFATAAARAKRTKLMTATQLLGEQVKPCLA